MHEYSMTSQIVESVLREANRRNARKVSEVRLVIGKLAFIGIDQVRFAYDLLVKDTIMQGSKLSIVEEEGSVECSSCGYRGTIEPEGGHEHHLEPTIFRCPKCGDAVNVISGNDIRIDSIGLVLE